MQIKKIGRHKKHVRVLYAQINFAPLGSIIYRALMGIIQDVDSGGESLQRDGEDQLCNVGDDDEGGGLED